MDFVFGILWFEFLLSISQSYFLSAPWPQSGLFWCWQLAFAGASACCETPCDVAPPCCHVQVCKRWRSLLDSAPGRRALWGELVVDFGHELVRA